MSIGVYGQTSESNCDSSETIEATLTVDGTAHDGSFENAGGLHYFQIDPATDIDVIIEATFTDNNLEYSLQLCDSDDNLIASDSNDNQNIWVPLISGTYYIVVGSSGADQYQLRVITDTRDKTSLSDCEDLTTSFPDDPLYGCQWYLKNTGQWRFNGQRITAGEDINVEGVWNDEIFGNGINVAVVDDGLDIEHEDLADNVNFDLNHDYSGNNNLLYSPFYNHGTLVAGVIATVGDNGVGVRGVAPQASIYAYNLLTGNNFTSANKADAMTRNRTTTAVSNNSWALPRSPSLKPVERTWEMAVETGIREGFGNKGVFYSFSAGNGHSDFDRANFDEHSNYYAVTSVCSTDGSGRKSSFSEEGVNLWVCAPGSGITTTNNDDTYDYVNGTSLSAPIVSGVAALMREVNSDLSWRDLKLILAASARKNDPTDPDWETVALKYGSDTENYNYNPKYGFGVVDAAAAVELAENWNRVSQMKTLMASSGNINMAIPDHTGGVYGELVSRLTIPDTDDLFTEFVEVNFTFTHAFFPELEIQITSPDGTVSQLSEEYIQGSWIIFTTGGDPFYTNYTHRFGSAKHLGEDPAGEWSLKISDTRSSNTGTLHSWSIKVYGHKKDDEAPDFGSETIDDQVYIAGTTTNLPVTLPVATGGNGALIYSLTPALPNGLNFNSSTREISGTPASAASDTYTYTVTDADRDTDQITFRITVVANEAPDFGSETIDDQVYIAGTTTNLPVTLPSATGGNEELTYSITPALPNGLNFNENTRVISGTPAGASSGAYTYTVTDADGDTAELTFGITIEVDSEPDFGSETIDDQVYIAGTTTNLPVTLPVATGGNGALIYNLTPALPNGLNFNSSTREISGTPASAASDTYTYTVTDADGDTIELTFGVTVENDSEPDFGSETIDGQVYIAGTTTNLPVTLPAATGGNEELTYSLTPSLPSGLSFNENTREISGTPASASSGTYTYTVTDEDGDTDQIMFEVTVEADSEPDFGSDMIDDRVYIAGTTTNLPVTLPVATGGNGALIYSLTPALPNGLNFNSSTREISGTPASAASDTYTYTATDADGDTTELTFGVTVEADSEPDFGSETIDGQVYITGTTTNLPVTLPAATGGNEELTYSLTPSLPSGLSFNENTREISGTPASASSGTYTYTVTDEDGDTDQITFGVTVEVDSMPDFGDTITDKEYVTGTAVTETLPLATGGNGALTYSITPELPAGLNFNENTRVISGTPTNAASKTTYTYTVTDRDGDTDQIMFGITVEADGIPNFGGDTIDDKEYVTGTAVTETLPVATGGNGALRYGLTPALPSGLSFNENTRVISGTPTNAASKTTYTYTVEDEDGDTAELTFGITVETDSIPNFGDMITDKEYVTGTSVTETLPVATGGNGALTYSITPRLPNGLTFNENTRVISGTPTSASSDTCTYTVTDEDGDTDQITFSITVETDTEPDFDSTTIPTQIVYTAGRPLTLPAATGGNPPVTYSITPRLPAGLRFNSNTRRISGTPTSASSDTYTYTVTDKNGDTAEVSFMLRVTAPPDRRPPPRPTPSSDTESGGGGGCAISDQNNVVSDLLGVMACLMLIPVSVVIRRKRRTQIKT